ncbi:MAG TPA: biotin--[acetyl-CoA-carboxylase] ligase [Actinomycetota bacterium]|nr:biotin--[acetyl-CoA-carboxylase] ligase [Actinomycetota bacterium]
MGQDGLERAVRASGIRVPPMFLEETGSTNLEARALAEAGAPEWTLVGAGHQTAGRGRMGRRWMSAPGRSLLFSVVLHPMLPPDDAAVVSLLAASEMAAACRNVAGVEVVSEWPNDLIAGRRKVGGILTETALKGKGVEFLVLGVGVNVSMGLEDFPEQVRGTATSLAMEGGSTEPIDLLAAFLSGFRGTYRPAQDGFARSVVGRYRPVCATLGRRVRATVLDGTTVVGKAVDLDDRGGLVLDVDGGKKTVGFGEIAHLD